MKYSFEQAWLNVQELHYEQRKESSNYLVGIELNGHNLTMTMTKQKLEPIIMWDDTFRMPNPRQEEEYAETYSDIVNMVITYNSFVFRDIEGWCTLIPECVKVCATSIYEWDIDEEEWHCVHDINNCHPIVIELWRRMREKDKEKYGNS